MASVIVFGPTGKSGSVAARTAASLGATVWLAMRDTAKPISGLSKADEDSGNYHRVQADLQNSETVAQAVKTSGAKRAFLYLAHGSQDHMKATLEALKTSGIEFVVFLSSFTILVDQELREIPADDLIPYWHAQVEANLDDIFGEGYVAVRCGAFVTNLLEEKQGIIAGKVHFNSGAFEQDNICPDDIGRVMGNILVNGPKNGQRKVYVYGPKIKSRRESILEIGKVLGKEIEVSHLPSEEAFERAKGRGVPERIARYLVDCTSHAGPDKGDGSRFPRYEEGVKNVETYTGRKAMGLSEWVEANRGVFDA